MGQGKLQPALLAGLFIGAMSGLPIVNMGNCCCCMWVIGGGVLAVYLRQQNTAAPLTSADGALLGLTAGAVGAVIGALISIPVQMLMGPMMQGILERAMSSNPDLPPELKEMMTRFGSMSGFAIAGALINLLVYSVFGLLGGLLGVAIFKKNTPPPPPSTPPVTTIPSPPPTVTTIPYDPGVAQ
ncbi:MAG: hypothetical protein ABIQ52_03965 [Vicinamibacterales bacterium]